MAEPTMQQRIAEAVRRKCVGPCGLSSDMARVLGVIVTRVADGVPIAPQELLAAELGLPLRTLSRCISQLGRAHGLVFVQRVGREPARYHVGWVELEAWAGAELRCATEGSDTPRWRIETPNGPEARARTATSSSSSSSSSEPTPPATGSEAFEQHQAMVIAARRALPSLPPAAREHIWSWVGRYPVLMVQEAARKTAFEGGKSLHYIESILQSEEAKTKYAEPGPENVVRFDDHRGLRPWVGV